VKIRKIQFSVFITVFVLLFSFSLIDYIQSNLLALGTKRWDNYIFSAPEQVSIQGRTYILYALTYYNGMPGPVERSLVVSWELGVDGFIFPIPLDLTSINKAWLTCNNERYKIDIIRKNNTTYLYRYIGAIGYNELDPLDLRNYDEVSVVVMFRYRNNNHLIKGKILKRIYVW
jgi:hypothetical protein